MKRRAVYLRDDQWELVTLALDYVRDRAQKAEKPTALVDGLCREFTVARIDEIQAAIEAGK